MWMRNGLAIKAKLGLTNPASSVQFSPVVRFPRPHSKQLLPVLSLDVCVCVCCGPGAGGRDGRGVCSADAHPVRPEESADGERAAAAGGAGGGAGLPGASAQPGRCGRRRPPAAMHTPGPAPVLGQCSTHGLGFWCAELFDSYRTVSGLHPFTRSCCAVKGFSLKNAHSNISL